MKRTFVCNKFELRNDTLNTRFGKQIGITFLSLLLLLPNGIKAQNNLMPDTLNCTSVSPAFAFSIQEAWISNTGLRIDTRHTPIVGDIDGDGNIEIFADNGIAGSGGILYVFEGKTGALAGQINCPGITASNNATTFTIFKRNASAKGSVFIAGRDNQIYLYEVRNSTRPLQFDLVWQKPLNVGYVVPVVADLDGDGNVEIVAGKYIIDANTGNVVSTLAVGSNNSHSTTIDNNFPVVADVDGDGLADVIVGSCVYRFNNGITLNPPIWKMCPRYGTAQEGANAVADINQDGLVDIVYIIAGDVTVWTPVTGTEVGRFSITLSNSVSYPFVGDIDGIITNGKKYPEICVNTASRLYAYSYNGTNLVRKWTMNHSDTSGATALTLFDFNNDGTVELVYRDETHLRIFDGSGNSSGLLYQRPCGSATIVETPVIADVTGDGSANIIVTGDPTGVGTSFTGEVMVFEGMDSKWASCPDVWHQQMYSSLLVNTDLTIPTRIKQVNHTFTHPDLSTVQFYNGGPMQAPYVSDETFWPIDLSPDLYIISGSFTINSATSVTISITVGNRGLAVANPLTPIRYYHTSVAPGNILSSANTTLGVYLDPGQTTTISKTITGLSSPLPVAFFVRLVDDGVNFPALGAFSDCNLSNNIKSFGTIELTKTAETPSCVDGTSTFYITLYNNSSGLNSTTYNNIIITDSIGNGWTFLNAYPPTGTTISSPYNSTTHKLQWSIPSLAPDQTVQLVITARANESGDLRNYSWITLINGSAVGRDVIEAYVIVASSIAGTAPTLSPSGTVTISTGGSVLLTASGIPGGTTIRWYRDGVPITGATSSTYTATQEGDYNVSYSDGACTSKWSNTAVVTVADVPSQSQVELMCKNTSKAITFNYAPTGKPYWFDNATYAANATNGASPTNFVYAGNPYTFTKNATSGVQKLYVRVQNTAGTAWINQSKVDTVKVFLVPDSMVWTGNTTLPNWNLAGNWNYINNPDPSCTECIPYQIPRECTNVLIPENRIFYPDLKSSASDYVSIVPNAYCNNIHFSHGGEVARTDSLHYTNAYVEMILKPNRWYMVSSPLQSMFPGDYYKTNPNPILDKMIAYTQLFVKTNPQTGMPDTSLTGSWTGTFNTPSVPMPAGFGFALWLDDDLGVASEHTMQFPKHDTQYYYYNSSGSIVGGPVSIPRSNEHKFVYEPVRNSSTGEITLNISSTGSDNFVIVGNPFMSHWIFPEFQTQNNVKIYDEYKLLLNNNSGDFTTYKLSSGDLMDFLIAPMQSIVLTTKGSFTDLRTNTTSTQPHLGGMLRSSNDNPPAGSLRIAATKDDTNSSTVITYNESATNDRSIGEDSYKLFVGGVTKPVSVYTRSRDGYALDINSFGDCTEPVPVGIRTSSTGIINLKFNGIENFMPDYDIFLLDTQTGNTKINLRKAPEYSFEKTTTDLFLDGRLYLSFSKVSNALSAPQDETVMVYINDGQLQIISNGTLIKGVQIIDMHGSSIHRNMNIESTFYTYDLPHINMCIVKISTGKGVIVKKVASN